MLFCNHLNLIPQMMQVIIETTGAARHSSIVLAIAASTPIKSCTKKRPIPKWLQQNDQVCIKNEKTGKWLQENAEAASYFKISFDGCKRQSAVIQYPRQIHMNFAPATG